MAALTMFLGLDFTVMLLSAVLSEHCFSIPVFYIGGTLTTVNLFCWVKGVGDSSSVSMPTLTFDLLWFPGIVVGRYTISPPPILLLTQYSVFVFFALPTQFGPVNKQRVF